MQKLLQFIFTKYISQEVSGLIPELYKLKPITLSSTQRIGTNDLQIIQYLLAKNFITYSPTLMQIKLNIKSILFYQRIYKTMYFVKSHLNNEFHQIFQQFIKNEFLPVKISANVFNSIISGQTKSKQGLSKKKLKPDNQQSKDNDQKVDYTRFIYESSQKKGQKQQLQLQCIVNINEVSDLLYYYKLEERLGNRKKQYLKNLSYKEGQQPLKSLSFLEMYTISKQNRPKSQTIKQLSNKIKDEKVQEYILQIFRKYDLSQKKSQEQPLDNINTKVSRNALLVFNLIKKNPYLSQKQLMNLTLNGVLQLRKCLNLLVAQGLINYYPENIRSIIYRITNYEQIIQRFINHICQSILNLHIAISNTNLSKEQLIKIECMIGQLDDILILFGY